MTDWARPSNIIHVRDRYYSPRNVIANKNLFHFQFLLETDSRAKYFCWRVITY